MIDKIGFKQIRKAIQGKYFKYIGDNETICYMRIVKILPCHRDNRFHYYCNVIKDGSEFKGGSGFFGSLESFYDRMNPKRIHPQEYKKVLQAIWQRKNIR